MVIDLIWIILKLCQKKFIGLYYKNPLISVCCDKYLFPKYIEEKLGKGYTVKMLDAWDDPKDIDFSKLPNQFVLKSNIGSGSLEIMIVKDKYKLNEFDTKNKLYEWIQFWSGRLNRVLFEEHLKNMKRKIIAEEYIK
ncbi:ATP-grasp fold amidoligase family protein [Brachyspira intermedia]|uniref:ATP-grasp fold amidoligase family protein n=1 Tax=Brachyspira intermedia TaxID=84377 RepID=UPI00300421AD